MVFKDLQHLTQQGSSCISSNHFQRLSLKCIEIKVLIKLHPFGKFIMNVSSISKVKMLVCFKRNAQINRFVMHLNIFYVQSVVRFMPQFYLCL